MTPIHLSLPQAPSPTPYTPETSTQNHTTQVLYTILPTIHYITYYTLYYVLYTILYHNTYYTLYTGLTHSNEFIYHLSPIIYPYNPIIPSILILICCHTQYSCYTGIGLTHSNEFITLYIPIYLIYTYHIH
jgi:hypothetical protein